MRCEWRQQAPRVVDPYPRRRPPSGLAPSAPTSTVERRDFVASRAFGSVAVTEAVTSFAAGYGRTCGIDPRRGVVCFGQRYSGSDWSYRIPSVIAGTVGAVSVSVYSEHACALFTGGGVRCWGYNRFGELGDGTSAATMIARVRAESVLW